MSAPPRTLSARWLTALKPSSWPKLLVPAFLGQAIGFASTGEVSFWGLSFGGAFTVLFIAYVVLLNDWGDRDVDRIKRQMFPAGCAPKTIPDGILPAGQLLVVGSLAGALAFGVAVAAGLTLARPLLIPGALASLALFVAYTLPPIRLNYRGGGEILEMIGVGLSLPWLNAYAQSGEPVPLGFVIVIPGFALLALASAIASGLSDERSDQKGKKRTFTTMLGNAKARRSVELAMLLGCIAWGVGVFLGDVEVKIACLIASTTAWDYLKLVYRQSNAAVTNAFAAQAVYKQLLHAGIWRSGTYMALTLVGMTILWSL
jgi:1,4-dihydroxy-2-naphthoate octaprenyltransferase/chlorophyll synthase